METWLKVSIFFVCLSGSLIILDIILGVKWYVYEPYILKKRKEKEGGDAE